jgi:hypothetical protein
LECGRAAAQVEKLGIPTVIVTRVGFTEVVANAFADQGFPADASQVVFGAELFLPGSNLSPLRARIDDVVAGLTTWQPSGVGTGVFEPPMITIEADNEQGLRDAVDRYLIRNLQSDGLPIVPPTVQRVDWILQGTDRTPDEILGPVAPRSGIATVRQVAVSLAMAGGRPEYLPITLAAVEAMLAPAFQHGRMNTTTCSVYPMFVVSGPVAHDIRLGSGYGALGPNPLRPAGASIGRAVRFVLMNVGGAVPGQTTMAIYGGPARFTGLVLAEDEAGLPTGWGSFGEEQGFATGENVVSAYAVSSTTNIPGGETGTEDAAFASLNRAAGTIGIPNGNYWDTSFNPAGAAGILVMARGTAQGLSAQGWSKGEIQSYLWERAKVPADELGPPIDTWWIPDPSIFEDPMPVSMSPSGIRMVIAGGDQSGHMMWLQSGCCSETVTSAAIVLPSRWSALLEAAQEDLGPIPVQ